MGARAHRAADLSVSEQDIITAIRRALRAGVSHEITPTLVELAHRRAACTRTASEFDAVADQLRRLGAPDTFLLRLRAQYRPTPPIPWKPLLAQMLVGIVCATLNAALAGMTTLAWTALAGYSLTVTLLAVAAFARRRNEAAVDQRAVDALPALKLAEGRMVVVVCRTLRWPPFAVMVARAHLHSGLRTRHRRASAKRASGLRSGTDPGDDDPEPPSRRPR